MHESMATFFCNILFIHKKCFDRRDYDQVSPQISAGKTDLFVYKQYLYKI